MTTHELKKFLQNLETVKPLIVTAKNNPADLKEWLIDRSQDVVAVKSFMRDFKKNNLKAFVSFSLGLKSQWALNIFIEKHPEQLASLAQAIKALKSKAKRFNDRLTLYNHNLEYFSWVNYLSQIGILINFAATAPQALQLLLVNNPEMAEQISQFVQETIPADKLMIFLEALKEFKTDPSTILKFLQQHPELKSILLENRTQLLTIADTLRKANFNAHLLKAKPLIELIFAKSATLAQQVGEQQSQVIADFNNYFNSLDKAKLDKITHRIKKLTEYREILKYEKEIRPELAVHIETKIKIIADKVKNLIGKRKRTVSATFLEALQQIESNPHLLTDFLKHHPRCEYYLTQNLAALVETADVIIAAKVSARPLLSENMESLNYFETQQLRNKVLAAYDKSFEILNVLKDFLQKFYKKEVKITTIADLSAEEITAAIYTNLISGLSFIQLNRFRQLPKNIENADSLDNRVWQSLQNALNMARIELGPLNPFSPHNPFNKEGISFNTLFVLNQLYQSSELLIESEASNEAIKTSLRDELLTHLTIAELIELDKVVINLNIAEPFLARFFRCLAAEVNYIRLHPENSANPFKQANVNENIIKFIYKIYTDTKQLSVDEKSHSSIRTELDLQLLSGLSTDELLALKSIANTVVSSDPLVSRFFQAFTEELTYQLENKRDTTIFPKVLQQMADHIAKKTLPELDNTIKRLEPKAKWSFFQTARDRNIAQNKLNELISLRSEINKERSAILISKSVSEQGPIKQAEACIKKHAAKLDSLIEQSLVSKEVNTHCNVLKGLVNEVKETLQIIKASFSQLYTKIWQNKPAEQVKEPTKLHYQYPGFFKTQTHKELEAIGNQAMPVSIEKLQQIEQTIAFKRG